MDKMSGKISHI